MARKKRPVKSFKNITIDSELGTIKWGVGLKKITPAIIKHFEDLWRTDPVLNSAPFPFQEDRVTNKLNMKNYRMG